MNPRALKRICRRSLGSAPSKRWLMPTRLAMFSLLVCAFSVAGTGAALAVSGASGSGSAGKAQYPPPKPSCSTGDDDGVRVKDGDRGDTVGVTLERSDGGPCNRVAARVATRQIESAGDAKLPFTGLAAIPLLLIGCGLLVAGVATRRRSASDRS